MPDLVTHTFSVYYFGRRPRWQRWRWMLYSGALLPDLVSRPIHILFPGWAGYAVAAHTPVFVFLCGALIAEGFAREGRAGVRLALWSGSGLHFLLDLFQRHLGDGYYWFFPFSWRSFEIGLWWPESTLPLVPVWVAILLLSERMGRR